MADTLPQLCPIESHRIQVVLQKHIHFWRIFRIVKYFPLRNWIVANVRLCKNFIQIFNILHIPSKLMCDLSENEEIYYRFNIWAQYNVVKSQLHFRVIIFISGHHTFFDWFLILLLFYIGLFGVTNDAIFSEIFWSIVPWKQSND